MRTLSGEMVSLVRMAEEGDVVRWRTVVNDEPLVSGEVVVAAMVHRDGETMVLRYEVDLPWRLEQALAVLEVNEEGLTEDLAHSLLDDAGETERVIAAVAGALDNGLFPQHDLPRGFDVEEAERYADPVFARREPVEV